MTKPRKFLRKDTHKKTRVGLKWRKPTGHQNKKRLHVKGHAPIVKPGYGTDNKKKNTFKDLEIIKIQTIEELKLINPKTQTILIKRLGAKKKIPIIEEAKKLNIQITNLNVKKFEENVEKKNSNKQKTAKNRKIKIKEKEDAVKKSEEKQNKKKSETKKEETVEDNKEEKKKKEKEEKDKILTKAK